MIREWLRPETQAVDPAPQTDPRARQMLWFEVAVVLLVTFGLSGLSSILSLLESALSSAGLGGTTVALNRSMSSISLIDLAFQVLSVLKLFAWAGLALYLLWRSGLGPRTVGLARIRRRPDVLPGIGLAALIGLPGLGLYFLARAVGANVHVVPTALHDTWWRLPTLVLWAIANAVAEETVVVAYLLSRLRTLGWSPNRALWASALLRGSYHLYQGIGGGLGNVVMGLVFGRWWQRTGRLWPLIIAHALIDTVAFVGYALLAPHLSWLR
ncbi:CPBP family intramembrane glutamic endopeptidase [Speluncibacter jeojiensis]